MDHSTNSVTTNSVATNDNFIILGFTGVRTSTIDHTPNSATTNSVITNDNFIILGFTGVRTSTIDHTINSVTTKSVVANNANAVIIGCTGFRICPSTTDQTKRNNAATKSSTKSATSNANSVFIGITGARVSTINRIIFFKLRVTANFNFIFGYVATSVPTRKCGCTGVRIRKSTIDLSTVCKFYIRNINNIGFGNATSHISADDSYLWSDGQSVGTVNAFNIDGATFNSFSSIV